MQGSIYLALDSLGPVPNPENGECMAGSTDKNQFVIDKAALLGLLMNSTDDTQATLHWQAPVHDLCHQVIVRNSRYSDTSRGVMRYSGFAVRFLRPQLSNFDQGVKTDCSNYGDEEYIEHPEVRVRIGGLTKTIFELRIAA